MPIEFFNKKISGYFTIPSGIVMTDVKILEKIANEIPQIGILTTKSISLNPRDGYSEPIFANISPGSFINAVGLANPGAKIFAQNLSKIKIPKDRFLLASIIGSNVEEFYQVAKILFKYVDAYELNISCPHAAGHGQAVGHDFNLVTKIIKSIKTLGKPVLVKLSPRIDVRQSMKALIAGGADGVVAINTWGPEEFLVDGFPVLSNKIGGKSGKTIFKEGIRVIKEIRKISSNIPIIGCGGIFTAKDVLKYKKAGANYFGIGSALIGLSTLEIKKYFKNINNSIPIIKKKVNMSYKKIIIKENKQLAPDLFLISFDTKISAKPGQFVMLWIPEVGEKPFSVYCDKPFEVLYLTRGCFTTALSQLIAGQELYYRGPYGNSPKLKGKVLLVGGGTGIAALPLFSKCNQCVLILGARDKNHLPDMKKWGIKNIYTYTEDGSFGKKGRVTDDLSEIIKKEKPKYILNCGPLPMIEAAVEIEKKHLNQKNILSSLELMTKCGVGICGRCATKDGHRNCVDGPFINNHQ